MRARLEALRPGRLDNAASDNGSAISDESPPALLAPSPQLLLIRSESAVQAREALVAEGTPPPLLDGEPRDTLAEEYTDLAQALTARVEGCELAIRRTAGSINGIAAMVRSGACRGAFVSSHG